MRWGVSTKSTLRITQLYSTDRKFGTEACFTDLSTGFDLQVSIITVEDFEIIFRESVVTA
jgi:hypothetical protein